MRRTCLAPSRRCTADARRPVGLPVHRSSLVGRTDDERRVRALLDHNRVVTLTGVGGVGKTRLAAHVAVVCMTEYGSIGFTTLSSITDSSDVAAAIVAALSDLDGWTVHDGVASVGDGAAAARTLLVVDNCEHVVDGAADAINDLANRWPSLTVLATSREQLGIEGEHVVVIRPLALDAAVRLFRERAAAAGADLGPASSRADRGTLPTPRRRAPRDRAGIGAGRVAPRERDPRGARHGRAVVPPPPPQVPIGT